MSWLYSQALVEEYWEGNFSDGEPSAPLSGNHTQLAYLSPDKMTEFSRLSRYGMTFKPLMENRGEELLTLYLEDFRAKTLVQQEKVQELKESDQECGEKWRASFAKYDPDMRLWKTHQCSLLGDLEPFSETFPQWGLMRDGECWEQLMLEQTIRGTESGLSPEMFPTPDANCGKRGTQPEWTPKRKSGHSAQYTLNQAVRDREKFPTPRSCSAMAAKITPESAWNEKRKANLETVVGRRFFPTPTAHNSKEGAYPSEFSRKTPSLATHAGGKLNPMWVEWLMGWMLGWTDLKPLEMDKSPCAPQPLGKS